MSWEATAEAIGMAPIWTHAVATGMGTMPQEKAEALAATLGLTDEAVALLQESPPKDRRSLHLPPLRDRGRLRPLLQGAGA